MVTRYHVTRRGKGSYAVKKENGKKASRVCSTQNEAKQSATHFANRKKDGGCVLVHRARNTDYGFKGQIKSCS